uniref:Phlebovirus glycoprotein G2 fusion domain-containing protein n=1 Tax=Meloidogyne incognita TaxID=6306 RepID=A0A914M8L7_MELIC
MSESENCRISNNTRICSVSSSTTLTLLPAGQPTNLLIKDEKGEILGALTFSLLSLTLNCNPKTLAFLRSYRINTKSVWRCPTTGSCTGSFCSSVGANTHVPEVVEVMKEPGASGCKESSALWSKGCGLPTASCHFYRWYAVPTSLDLFELFSCPTWDFNIKAMFQLTASSQTYDETAILQPGLTHHWLNTSITPIAVTNPPSPTLSTPFLTNGFSVALGQDVPRDLKCADAQSALGFGCNISKDACRECHPITDGSVECQCREFDGEAILADPEKRLPLNINRQTFLAEGESVQVEQPYSPIQVHFRMSNFRLVNEITESTCRVSVTSIGGCYKCTTGVQIKLSCFANFGTTLAHIKCEDGISLVSRCSKEGIESTTNFAYNRSKIDTMCKVNCPGGKTPLHLQAQLLFIPIKWRLDKSIQSVRGEAPSKFNIDFIKYHPFSLFLSAFIPSIQFLIPLIFIFIIVLIFIVLRYKLKMLSKLAFFLPLLLVNLLPGGEGVRDPKSPDGDIFSKSEHNRVPFQCLFQKIPLLKVRGERLPSGDIEMFFFQKILLQKLFGKKSPDGDTFLLKLEKSIALIQWKELGKRPNKKLFLQKDERPQFGRIGFPFVKGETKTLKWPDGKFLPKGGHTIGCPSNSPSPISLLLAHFIFKTLKRSLPPPLLVGETREEYLSKCQKMAYSPEYPKREENLAEYLIRIMGPVNWDNLEIRRMAEGLIFLVWDKLMLREQPMTVNRPVLSRPAFIELVEPYISVEKHFKLKGQPLKHPNLPCLVVEGGVRGTTRKSRKNSRIVGHRCWRSGQVHRDYTPLEKIVYLPEGPANPPETRAPTPPPQPTLEQVVEKDEEIRIVARGIKTLTITFLICAVFFSSVMAIEPILVENRNFCLSPHPSRFFSVSPYLIQANLSFENYMSKQPSTKEARELRKQREKAYCEQLGKPVTLEDFDLMNEWLDTGSDIIPITNESVLDFNEDQPAENTLKNEKISNVATPPEQQPFYSILNPPPAPPTTTNKDNNQSEKPALQQKLQKQPVGLETEFLRQRERRKDQERSERRKAEAKAEKRREEERQEHRALMKAILESLGKKPVEIASKEILLPGPKPQETPAAVPLSQIHVQASVPPSKPSYSGRKRPWGQSSSKAPAEPLRIPASAADVEKHLKFVHLHSECILESIKSAYGHVDESVIKSQNPIFVQHVLAIEAAAVRLKKTIKTAFFELNIEP